MHMLQQLIGKKQGVLSNSLTGFCWAGNLEAVGVFLKSKQLGRVQVGLWETEGETRHGSK